MRKEKQLLLDEIKNEISESTAFIVTRYKDMSPNLSHEFRTHLNKFGGSFTVVKKNILRKAAEVMGKPLGDHHIEGHVGVIFTKDDPVAIAKAFYTFQREKEGLLDVVLGYIDGQLCLGVDVEMVSKLPSKEQMRAELLATLEAPMANVLSVIDSALTSVIYCLENKTSETE